MFYASAHREGLEGALWGLGWHTEPDASTALRRVCAPASTERPDTLGSGGGRVLTIREWRRRRGRRAWIQFMREAREFNMRRQGLRLGSDGTAEIDPEGVCP